MKRSARVCVVALASVVAAALLPMSAQAAPGGQPRIIGGTEAQIQDAPWQVALVNANTANPFQAQFCGGSIISAEWIVTAAHCVDFLGSPDEVQVVAGTATLPDSDTASITRYDVQRILISPDWNSSTNESDVALLKLASPLPLDGTTMAPIAIPTFSQWPATGTTALITGWGNVRTQADPVYPSTLRKATVTILSGPGSPECGNYPAALGPGSYDPALMLCAGTGSAPYIDACQGDSGGPLAIQRDGQWYLAGITSWGTGCAEPGYPGIYTRVTAVSDWIRSAQAPGATGSLTVTGTGPDPISCAFVYNANILAGPIATRCGADSTSITVPDVFPGKYLVRTTFDSRYTAATWYAAKGPVLKRESATSVKVSGAKDTRVKTSGLPGTAFKFEFPSSASDLGSSLCVQVFAISVDLWRVACLTRGSASVPVLSMPQSSAGYRIYVEDRSGKYASYYYSGAGQSGTLAEEQAQAVMSPVNTDTTVSLTLTAAGRISGSVSSTPQYEPYARVSLYVDGVDEAVATASVQSDGTYVLWWLPPGTYRVRAWDAEGVHGSQWWNGVSSRESATPVSVTAGASVTGISMRLQQAGLLTGTVTGPGGAALSPDADLSAILYRDGARVDSTTVDADGVYRFGGLEPGDYKVDFRDEAGVYYSEFYDGSPTIEGATAVTVSALSVTSGIDVSLALIQRIEITASRTGKGAKSQIVVRGTTAGLVGSRVVPWIKLTGAKSFVASKPVTVGADGTFTWSYRTPKGAAIYVKGGSVTSSTVTVAAAR